MTRSLNDYAAAYNLDNDEALEQAEEAGITICKHADPFEGAREGLTAEEAVEVAAEDSALIYLQIEDSAVIDYLDAVEHLNAIDDATWEQVCGDQDRPTFARLALDAGQGIEAAWAEASAHADRL